MPTKLNSTTKELLKQFSIMPKKVDGKRQIVPATIDRETGNMRALQMDTDVQRLFKIWASDLTSSEDLKSRFQRYRDTEFMVQNSGYISLAAKLYSNEAISPDESGKIINVYAKDKKVEAYINNFFQEVGVNRAVLENTSFDIATFSDSFWIRSIEDGKGITEITPISPYLVTARLEFSAIEELRKQTKNFSYAGASQIKMDDLIQILEDGIKNADYAQMYKRYLFGYSLEENKVILPPWAISHFRRFSTQSEFAPYGRPLLINSLSLFREYMSGKNLVAMARVARFPKEVFKIKVDESMTPVEKMLAINEARQEYQNFVNLTNSKEDYGIGASIWTAIDSFEYELLSNNIDLGDVSDIEMLRDELIASTLIPKGYLIGGDSSWGDAGKALLQQSKIFSREVLTNQTAILTELTDLVKTQFVLMNLYDGEDTEFELSLAFPTKEQSGDNITIQKDTMELAQAIIDNLKTALAIDSIPPEVAKDILNKYAAFDKKDLDRWMKDIQASVDLEIKQAPEFEEPEFGKSTFESATKLKKAIGRLSEEIFRESFFQAKKDVGLNEGVMDGRHFMLNNKTSRSDRLKFAMMKENYSSKGSKKLKE